jgi:hypothetical protein
MADTLRLFSDPHRVAYRCPWCGVPCVVAFNATLSLAGGDYGLTTCSNPSCGQPALIRVPEKGLINGRHPREGSHVGGYVYPAAEPVSYRPEAVPPGISRDFQEGLRCQAAGYLIGAALVGRRVLQSAVRDRGGAGRSLQAEIDSLADGVLAPQLKAHAHEVRLIGNEAAHDGNSVGAEDVDDLMTYTTLVLDHLYVMPARLAATQLRRRPPS